MAGRYPGVQAGARKRTHPERGACASRATELTRRCVSNPVVSDT